MECPKCGAEFVPQSTVQVICEACLAKAVEEQKLPEITGTLNVTEDEDKFK
jgi:uncharacterized OB-fold protein